MFLLSSVVHRLFKDMSAEKIIWCRIRLDDDDDDGG